MLGENFWTTRGVVKIEIAVGSYAAPGFEWSREVIVSFELGGVVARPGRPGNSCCSQIERITREFTPLKWKSRNGTFAAGETRFLHRLLVKYVRKTSHSFLE